MYLHIAMHMLNPKKKKGPPKKKQRGWNERLAYISMSTAILELLCSLRASTTQKKIKKKKKNKNWWMGVGGPLNPTPTACVSRCILAILLQTADVREETSAIACSTNCFCKARPRLHVGPEQMPPTAICRTNSHAKSKLLIDPTKYV